MGRSVFSLLFFDYFSAWRAIVFYAPVGWQVGFVDDGHYALKDEWTDETCGLHKVTQWRLGEK